MAAGERDHFFILIDGEIFNRFREVPQTDDIRLPCEDFFLHVEEDFRQGLARQRAAAQSNKVIAPQNIQHGRAVIHRVTLSGNDLLLRFIAAQHKEQIAAILLIQLIPGAVFHRQMVRRHDDDRIFKIRRGFDFLY